ncbi:MAG: Eco57I restriction-modification methylase domain-containing protein [Chloroflexota bacterium]|nr:Eco57I restriction-modification methylase domain-containing protein [Chloroflexota bacterium]
MRGSTTFLVDLFRNRPKPGNTYFSEVLVPLFFDGVGRPPEDSRHQAAMAALGGSVPYLDGGLFRADADAFERALLGVDTDDVRHHAIVLPDALFDPATDNPDQGPGRQERHRTVLGLLRGYRFTTQESTPDDQSVDPDPELLGKVFENLYQADDRHQAGAYYTPREVVRYMCRRALDGYLLDHAAEHVVTQEMLGGLRDEAVDWETTHLHLSAAQERVLTIALERVTVIDPAVGSGAFLVGMLQEITLLRRGIRSAALDAQIERGSEDVYAWKRQTVTRSLHGVDVNPTAVEICRLRLWLSLVIEYDLTRQRDIPPLPNLEFRVVAGDSLVDRVGAVAFRQSLPESYVQTELEMQRHLERLDRAIGQYREADRDGSVRRVRRHSQEIRSLQQSIASTQMDRTIDEARHRLTTLEKAARPSQRAIATVKGELLGLEQMRENLRSDAPVLKPLLWPLVFREVFERERGGFDIVVANPPYVRQESISAVDQRAYGAAFKEFYAGTGDLYVSFFARALQVAREGGWLSFITSNKYMRAGYGERPRRALATTTRIAEVIDFGDLPVFSAAAYPAIFIGQKRERPETGHPIVAADLNLPVRRRLRDDGRAVNVDHVRTELDDLPELIREARAANYPQALLRSQGWILEDPVLVRLFDRLMNEGTPLGEHVNGRMYYGIKTGLNKAFVIDQATRDALIAADPRSEEVIKPWLRGRDIKRWQPEWAGLYVIFTRRGIDIEAYPAIREHLMQWREELEPKEPGDRTRKKGQKPGSYKWYEIQDNVAYWREFEQPKLLWPDITPESRFVWDESGYFTDTTIFQSTGASPADTALLNSELAEFLLLQLCPTIRGGFLRLKIQYLETFPMPQMSENTRTTLDVLARSASSEDTPTMEIDDLVSSAYDLSPTERTLIGRWIADRKAIIGADIADRGAIDEDESTA